MSRMKEIIDSNKDSFADCTIHTANLTSLLPMKNPMSEKSVSWSTQSQKATLVKLSTALLRNSVPVLVVGDNFAMEVFEEIKTSVVKQVNATKVEWSARVPIFRFCRRQFSCAIKTQLEGTSRVIFGL